MSSALNKQIKGSHYKNMAIQPAFFCYYNNINYIEGNIIKYICRYKKKNGLQDLLKAKHYLELLIEFYGRKTK